MADPSHEEHDYFLDVYGDEYDPTSFDVEMVNMRLQNIKRKLARSHARAKQRS